MNVFTTQQHSVEEHIFSQRTREHAVQSTILYKYHINLDENIWLHIRFVFFFCWGEFKRDDNFISSFFNWDQRKLITFKKNPLKKNRGGNYKGRIFDRSNSDRNQKTNVFSYKIIIQQSHVKRPQHTLQKPFLLSVNIT